MKRLSFMNWGGDEGGRYFISTRRRLGQSDPGHRNKIRKGVPALRNNPHGL